MYYITQYLPNGEMIYVLIFMITYHFEVTINVEKQQSCMLYVYRYTRTADTDQIKYNDKRNGFVIIIM